MRFGKLYRENDQKLILDKVMLTANPLEQMRGLLGRPAPAENEGLVIQPCSSIHTIGMSYPIDVIFLDNNWCVRKLISSLGSFRMAWCRNSHMVLETMVNNIARWQLEPEHTLRWEED